MINKKIIFSMALAVTAGAVLADGWTVQVGPRVQTDMQAELSGAGYANSVGTDYLPGSSSRSRNPWDYDDRPAAAAVAAPADDITVYADRAFDDGFVNVSPPTVPTGNTWFWGYDNAAQYDGAADQLTFTRNTAVNAAGQYTDRATGFKSVRTVSVTDDSAADDTESFSAAGLEILLAKEILSKETFSVEFISGLSAVFGQEQTLRDQTWSATVRQDDYRTWRSTEYTYQMNANYQEVYTYNDPLGAIPALGVPYAGTFAGPGYVIPELPADRVVNVLAPAATQTDVTGQGAGSDRVRSRTWTARNRVEVDAEISSMAIRAGFRAAFALRKGVRVFVEPQAAMHYMTADLTRKECIIVTAQDGSESTPVSWRETENDESWIPAVGMMAGANVDLKNGWFAEVAAGYEWTLDEPEFDIGPSKVKVDLSGIQATAGIGKRF